MNEWTYIAMLLATAVGYFCAGRLWESRRLLFWRLQWIELEHRLATLEHREPRDIESVKSNAEMSHAPKNH